MSFSIVKVVADRFARMAGYVPQVEMAAALADKERIEQELRHKTRNLEQQIVYRNQLEKEIGVLKELEAAHARNESGIVIAIDRLNLISSNLLDMMKSVWPEAYAVEQEACPTI